MQPRHCLPPTLPHHHRAAGFLLGFSLDTDPYHTMSLALRQDPGQYYHKP